MLQELIQEMGKALQALYDQPTRTIHLFHHNDADGLCSAAILMKALGRKGFQVLPLSLEKPYPPVLERIFQSHGRTLIFADFAGRIAPLLSRLNRGRNLTLILDHHVAQRSTDPRIFNLDPDLYGLKGDRDITASTTCFLFARKLDPSNCDLAHIAALGAVGDKFFVQGRLVSQNREAALEAVRQGTLEIRKEERGERYFLHSGGKLRACDPLAAYLDTLGGVGYYRGGPEIGVKVCLSGPWEDSDRRVRELEDIRSTAFLAELERLRAGALQETPHIQWFHVQNRFAPMGVKMVGLFCEELRVQDFMDPKKYVAGFQNIPDEIPGFGRIKFGQVKISMRVSSYLEHEIRTARRTGLDILLPEATHRLGGFSDACHSLTAATTIGAGKEEALIQEMEAILQERGR